MTQATVQRDTGTPVGDPLVAGRAPRSRVRRLRARLLPRGVDLSQRSWTLRHRAVLAFLWLMTTAATVWSFVAAPTDHAALEAVGLVAASALTTAIPARRRGLAASAASVTLLLATAVLVHLSGGLIEMHFLFFVIVAAVTLYQQWAPFLSAIVFVTLHHGVVGTTHPEATYNHPAAIEHPWLWAGVHGGFVALASIVGLAGWRFDELVRDELRQVGEHHRVVLDSVRDAVLALDGHGRIVSLNTRAATLLGAPAAELVGREVHRAVHPGAHHPADRCPLAGRDPSSASGTDEVEPHPGDAVPVPVTYRLAAVEGDGEGGVADGGAGAVAVLTLTDVSGARRALVAERQLRHLTAERLVERAEVEQLAASVSPPPLELPGVELAATYLPASESLLGGDLYDWFASPDGTIHVAVFDAMGKGRGATKHAIAVMHAVRVLALDGVALQDLLRRAAGVLADHDDDLMATAVVARYRPDTGDLEAASAGHPPALVVRRDGGWEYLETVGIGIGVPGAGSQVLRSATLAPGDTLVLYSDGLIEGTRDLDRGLADLALTAAAAVHEDPATMADRLAREGGSVAVDDDRVVLVLRRTTT